MEEAGVSHGAKQREAAPQSAKAFCALPLMLYFMLFQLVALLVLFGARRRAMLAPEAEAELHIPTHPYQPLEDPSASCWVNFL